MIMSKPVSPRIQHGAFYNNPRIRALFYQFILVSVLVYFFYAIVSNAISNMEARGIKSGFEFLKSTAGFDILMSLIPYDATHTYGRTFLVGLLNTLLVSTIGIVLATIIGFLMGIAYFSSNWLVKRLSVIYVETFRNIPLLLQVFFWYFAVLASLPGPRQSFSLGESVFLNVRGLYLPEPVAEPGALMVFISLVVSLIVIFLLRSWAVKRKQKTGQEVPIFKVSLLLLLGVPLMVSVIMGMPFHLSYPELKGFNFQGGISVIPELMALVIALSVYTGAFIAEAVRAGVQSVPTGQIEAAKSLGLSSRKIMSLIVVPQAMRVITPLLNSEYQSLVKNSTLATAIGYPDLFTVFVGTTLNQTGQAIEIMFMTMCVYFVVNMLISLVMNRFNQRVALVTR
jgi:general L-amino acid transport system permease protein